VENYYTLLGVAEKAEVPEIKKAFRQKAKKLHPDIAGEAGAEMMRRLLAAYQVLIDPQRRENYDRALGRFLNSGGFDYRLWLREGLRDDNPRVAAASRAKLIFFELLHLEEEEAIRLWREGGGLKFALERYLDRDDWLDGIFMLAEELGKRGDYYSAFMLFACIIKEERRKPYFRHFTVTIEAELKELVRLHLRRSVDAETYIECMELLLQLGFPANDEARWFRSLAEALARRGALGEAQAAYKEAQKRNPHSTKRKAKVLEQTAAV
jgi:tetratricopeptide (TPR) repeat protein